MMITDFRIFEDSLDSRMKLMDKYLDGIISDMKELLISVFRFNEGRIKVEMTRHVENYYKSVKISVLSTINNNTNRDLTKEEGLKGEVSKLISRWDKKIRRFGFHVSSSYRLAFDDFLIIIKNMKMEKMIPNRYIYHCSPKSNRESIMKHGLKLKNSRDSMEWGGNVYLSYPPAVFATNNTMEKVWDSRHDIWRIDTKGLPNEWWMDVNCGKDEYNALITFKPIPPTHLKLVKK